MAHLFVRRSGIKRAVSLVLSAAMFASLITVPAFGAPAEAVPSNYKPGSLSSSTTNIASVEGTGSLGYLGKYSFDVEGTPATRAFVQSNVQYLTDASRLVALADLNVPTPLDSSTVPVVSYSDEATTFATPVAGLTPASTVADLVQAMDAQFAAYLDADFDNAFRIRLTAKRVGDVTIGVSDEYSAETSPDLILGMADAAFRGTAAPGDWSASDGATSGTDYSVDYGPANVEFLPLGGKAYGIGATIGHIAGGSFTIGVDPSTGFFTAIKLADGHDFVLKTDGTKDVRLGAVSFEAVDGVRVPVNDATVIIPGANTQAGQEETITVSLSNDSDLEDATNGMQVVLPSGFAFASPTSVNFVSSVASVSVSADARMMEFSKFQVDGSGDADAPASVDPLTVEIRVKNATQSDHTLGLDGTEGKEYRSAAVLSRNVAGTDWTEFASTDLRVDSENIVAADGVVLDSTEINAGGWSKITGELFDQYGNEIVEWGRSITFDLASETPTPTGSFSESFIATDTPASPFATSFRTSVTPGQNVVRATVPKTAAGDEQVTGTTIVDTRDVGDPYQVLILEKDGKSLFPIDGTPTFYVKVVDENGKGTSFLNERRIKVVRSSKDGSESTRWAIVPAGYSTSQDFSFWSPNRADVWQLTATDWFGGAALPSTVVTVEFSSDVVPGEPYELQVTAVRPIPGQQMNTPYYEYLYNQAGALGLSQTSFGYAKGDGADAVELTAQVVDEMGAPLREAGIEVAYTVPAPPLGGIPGVTYPGKLSSMTGVTDENGQVKVKATSTVGSRERFAPDDLVGFGNTTYFTPVSFETTLPASVNDYGFAYFVRGQLNSLESDKSVILADGEDAAVLTASVTDQAFGMPVEDWSLTLSTSAGELSSESVKTDADGLATVSLTSDSMSPDEATVVAVDEDGNRASADVRFSDLRMSLAPVGEGIAQGGYGATQDVRLSFERLDGTPVLFSGIDWMDGDLSFDGGSVSFKEFEEVTTPEGEVNSAAIYTAQLQGENAEGTFAVSMSSPIVYRNQGIFQFNDEAPQTVSTDLTFDNTAAFSAKLVLNPFSYWDDYSELTYESGTGFLPPASGALRRYADVRLVGANVDMSDAVIRPDGSVVPQYAWADEGLRFLEPGKTYDLMVDGLLFKDALTVSEFVPEPEVKSDVTVTLYGGSADGAELAFYGSVYEAGNSSKVRNVEVFLQKLNASGIWVDASDVALPTRSGTTGQYRFGAFTPANGSTTYYRVLVKSDDECNEGISAVVKVVGKANAPVVNPAPAPAPKPVVKVKVNAPSTAKANKSFTIKGTTSLRNTSKVKITVYRKSGSKYVKYKTYTAKVNSKKAFSYKLKLKKNKYKIKASYINGAGWDYTNVK